MNNFSLISMTEVKDLLERNERQAELITKLRLKNGYLKQRIEKQQFIIDRLQVSKITFKDQTKINAHNMFMNLKK